MLIPMTTFMNTLIRMSMATHIHILTSITTESTHMTTDTFTQRSIQSPF